MDAALVEVKRIRRAAVIFSVGCAVVLGGCGTSDTGSSSYVPPSSRSRAKMAATGPAITEKLSFDRLALASAIRRVKKSNGVVYYYFRYMSRDGQVYDCELPAGMADGKYSPEEWIRTFDVYRLPAPVKQKPGATKPNQGVIADYPFISPRPQVEQAPQQAPEPSPQVPVVVPQLPSIPTSPSVSPSVPPSPLPPPARPKSLTGEPTEDSYSGGKG